MEVKRYCDVIDWGYNYSAWDDFAKKIKAPKHVQELFEKYYHTPTRLVDWDNNWLVLIEKNVKTGSGNDILRIIYKPETIRLIASRACRDKEYLFKMSEIWK